MKPIAMLCAILLALAAAPAHAHGLGAQVAGFQQGFAHPLDGLDHLLAMLGVGMLAGQSGGRALWLVPVSCLAAMGAGGLVGFAGVALPGIELGIAGSVLLLGFLIALAPRLPLSIAATLMAVFALCHGYAHGAEAPGTAASLGYGLGFILAGALVQMAGIGLAAVTWRRLGAWTLRIGGVVLAVAGSALLAG